MYSRPMLLYIIRRLVQLTLYEKFCQTANRCLNKHKIIDILLRVHYTHKVIGEESLTPNDKVQG